MIELAQVIWAEARGETDLGKRAVAHVVLNRSKNSRFPNSVPAVARQRGQFVLKTGFGKLWEKCKAIANDPGEDPTNGALYFATYKAWPKRRLHCKIGSHYFYS